MNTNPRPRVFVTGTIPVAIAEALGRDFCLASSVRGADGILATITTIIDDTFLDVAGPQLRIVANYGVGVDNIDLTAATRRNVVVTNTPNVLTDTTAELAVALMLSLLRRVVEGDRFLRRNQPWTFSLSFMVGEGLKGKTLGIIGPGRIGRETARLATAFGANPVFCGRADPLDPLLHAADIVSLHCPLLPETRHLIDSHAFRQMRPSAILVNTARGGIVSERDLVAALSEGRIAGAALDVFEFEPKVSEELLAFDNVVLTPHIGSGTHTTREAMGLVALDALRAVLLESRRPDTFVV